MDLPHDTPAGDGVATAFAVGQSVIAGEKRDITPVGDAPRPSHNSGGGGGLRRFFPSAPGSNSALPFVLDGKMGMGPNDSTEDFRDFLPGRART
jgi:hypothetical protein